MKLTKKGWAFLGLAFGIAWGILAIAWAAGVRAGSAAFTGIEVAMMFSPLAPAVAHGTLNGVAGVAIMPLSGGSNLTVGLTGLAGFAALGIVLAALYLIDRRGERPIMRSRIGQEG